MNNVQTPTSHTQTKNLSSPKMANNKSTSQNDLKSGMKKQEMSAKKRTQDVRELSVKKSLLAADHQ